MMEGIKSSQSQSPTPAGTGQAPQSSQSGEALHETGPPFSSSAPEDSKPAPDVISPNPIRRSLDEVLRDLSYQNSINMIIGSRVLDDLANAILMLKDQAALDCMSKWSSYPTAFEYLRAVTYSDGTLPPSKDTLDFSAAVSLALQYFGGDFGSNLAQLNDKCNEYLFIESDTKPAHVIELATNCIVFCVIAEDGERASRIFNAKSLIEDIEAAIWEEKIDVEWQASLELAHNVSGHPADIKHWENLVVEKTVWFLDALRTVCEHEIALEAMTLHQDVLSRDAANTLNALLVEF